MRRVAVLGAGPGGLAAARRLAGHGVPVALVTRDGRAEHLGSAVDVALGLRAAEACAVDAAPSGVDVVAGEATALDGGGVVLADGTHLDAVAVIAAPGLALDFDAVPRREGVIAAWDVASAAVAAEALDAVPGGRVVIAVAGVPYRCPPAPFGLAMALADMHRRSGRFTELTVISPEPLPLAGVGGEAPGFLLESCAGADVALELGVEIDLAATGDGELRTRDGRSIACKLALIVPPHRRSAALAGLPGDGPLVPVDVRGRAAEGVWVVGDAAATGLPRAAGVAEAQGRTAADDVLATLGLAEPRPPELPEPACYLRHAGGGLSRIRLRFPDGLPPDGAPTVAIDGPSPDLVHALDGERERFLATAAG